MSCNTEFITLSKKEFELINKKLVDVPEEPFDKIMAIAQAVFDSGISEDRLTDVFCEVCKRL